MLSAPSVGMIWFLPNTTDSRNLLGANVVGVVTLGMRDH